MEETREGVFAIWIGTTGTRKTTDIKAQLTPARERNLIVPSGRDDVAWHGYPELKWNVVNVPDEFNPKRLVPKVVVPELNTFTGTRVLHVDGKQPIFNAIIDPTDGYRNGRVVFDDFRNYVMSNGTLRTEVATFFRNRRHKMLDIYMACHTPEDVSRQMLALNPTLVIGWTTTSPTDTSIDKMANGQLFLDTLDEMRRVNQARPEGQRYIKRMLQM